ncbi:hypothetical protein FXO37_13731 [Capsicum annuum]|nr:hypothetical protein FXO37_13731 [Capsicum annuum]
MAAFAITSFTHTPCTSHHFKKKQWPHQAKSIKITNVMTPKVEEQTHLNVLEIKDRSNLLIDDNAKPTRNNDEVQGDTSSSESQDLRYSDERWKNGTWDLNMLVKNGKMNWDAVIVAGLIHYHKKRVSAAKERKIKLIFVPKFQPQLSTSNCDSRLVSCTIELILGMLVPLISIFD